MAEALARVETGKLAATWAVQLAVASTELPQQMLPQLEAIARDPSRTAELRLDALRRLTRDHPDPLALLQSLADDAEPELRAAVFADLPR